jgi:tRNA threonylcarbamoyladenosine biosynthesis protein TsaE
MEKYNSIRPRMTWQGVTSHPDDTKRIGVHLGRSAQKGNFFAFCGPLGSGKTTLIQGFAEGFEVENDEYVRSPTFALVHQYRGKHPLYHFDFYRLSHWSEAQDIGFTDYLDGKGVVVVEWADRFPQLWPTDRLEIHIKILPAGGRSLYLRAYDAAYARFLRRIPYEVYARR